MSKQPTLLQDDSDSDDEDFFVVEDTKKKKTEKQIKEEQELEKLEKEQQEKKQEQIKNSVDDLWASMKLGVKAPRPTNNIKKEETPKASEKIPETTKKEIPTNPPKLTGKKRPSIDDLIGSLGKKKKLNTFEQSKLDWDKFTEDNSLKEELQRDAKNGYLEKQDFLERADQKQFEIEKEHRNSIRSKQN